jgi:transposase-like protein
MKQPNKFNSQLQQEILDSFQQLVKALIKTLLEALMLEEREIYLEETEDYANGFYSRDLLTALGEVKGLRVPRVRKGSFRPVILPERRKAGLDLAEVVISLYASGVSMRKIKVIEVFPDEGSVERLLYLILKEMNERLNSRRLRGFKEIESGNYHALPGESFTQ